jgi:multidrug efflux pump subunit AcrA (membrane-fusion protein)
VQDVDVASGKRVAVAESLGRLIDAAGLEVRFEIPNGDYARLIGGIVDTTRAGAHPLAGTEVRVQWRLGEFTYSYQGVIERAGAEVDSGGGGVTLYARILHGPIEILRQGAFVEVTVPDVAYDDVIVLPETAVSDHKILYFVEDSRLVAREVEVVGKFEDKVLVRGDIAPQSAIVAEQFPAIGPGLRVQSH